MNYEDDDLTLYRALIELTDRLTGRDLAIAAASMALRYAAAEWCGDSVISDGIIAGASGLEAIHAAL